MGTSRNTGSDKQTYYKLSLCGSDGDSVREMADTLTIPLHRDLQPRSPASPASCRNLHPRGYLFGHYHAAGGERCVADGSPLRRRPSENRSVCCEYFQRARRRRNPPVPERIRYFLPEYHSLDLAAHVCGSSGILKGGLYCTKNAESTVWSLSAACVLYKQMLGNDAIL